MVVADRICHKMKPTARRGSRDNGMMPKIKVLIIEDHPSTAKGLMQMLSEQPDFEVLGSNASAHSGLKAAYELAPQIVLLDLHLRGSEPATKVLSDFCTGTPWNVVVFSAEHRMAFVEAALQLGARGFLLKEEPASVLYECLRQVASGASEPIVSQQIRRLKFELPQGLDEVLRLIGQGLKYHEIAARRNSSPETVRKQCERLQIRLGLGSREQLISWAVANGYAAPIDEAVPLQGTNPDK